MLGGSGVDQTVERAGRVEDGLERAKLTSLVLFSLVKTGTYKGSSSFFEAAVFQSLPGLPVSTQVHRHQETIQYNQNAFVLLFLSLSLSTSQFRSSRLKLVS